MLRPWGCCVDLVHFWPVVYVRAQRSVWDEAVEGGAAALFPPTEKNRSAVSFLTSPNAKALASGPPRPALHLGFLAMSLPLGGAGLLSDGDVSHGGEDGGPGGFGHKEHVGPRLRARIPAARKQGASAPALCTRPGSPGPPRRPLGPSPGFLGAESGPGQGPRAPEVMCLQRDGALSTSPGMGLFALRSHRGALCTGEHDGHN